MCGEYVKGQTNAKMQAELRVFLLEILSELNV